MKRLKLALVGAILIFCLFGLFWFNSRSEKFIIRDADFNADYHQVSDLFHKGDNWYWMICNANQKTYSLEHMFKYKSSSQYERKNDLVVKVLTDNNKVVGFLGYYPYSTYVWQLLFLIVDQDYRKQGLATKLLTYAVNDMVGRGAIKIMLATRVNNMRAQSLYKKFGFKLTDFDNEFSHFVWYKQ